MRNFLSTTDKIFGFNTHFQLRKKPDNYWQKVIILIFGRLSLT